MHFSTIIHIRENGTSPQSFIFFFCTWSEWIMNTFSFIHPLDIYKDEKAWKHWIKLWKKNVLYDMNKRNSSYHMVPFKGDMWGCTMYMAPGNWKLDEENIRHPTRHRKHMLCLSYRQGECVICKGRKFSIILTRHDTHECSKVSEMLNASYPFADIWIVLWNYWSLPCEDYVFFSD